MNATPAAATTPAAPPPRSRPSTNARTTASAIPARATITHASGAAPPSGASSVQTATVSGLKAGHLLGAQRAVGDLPPPQQPRPRVVRRRRRDHQRRQRRDGERSRPLVELQLSELRPARIRRGLVLMLGILVEVRPALAAQPRAVLAARDLRRQRERQRVARPLRQRELLVGVTYGELSSSPPPGRETSRASTSNDGAAGSRQRMHGPSSAAVKRSRSAQPLPVVRETSSRTGTSAGVTAYGSPA